MGSPGLRRRDKENAGAVYESAPALKLVSVSAERRPAIQESSGAHNSQAFADGTRPGGDEHLKLRISQSDVVKTVVEVRQEPQQGATAASECNDVDRKASRQLDFTLDESTERQTVNIESFRPRQAQHPAPQPDPAAAASPAMPVKKAHPAGAQGTYARMESSTRCYTEVLQIVKPKPEKVQIDGPLWRLPGPSFGATQRSPGMHHASSKVKGCGVTSHRQEAQKVQQPRPVARKVSAKPSKLPPARTYAALAERRRALQAQPQKGGCMQGAMVPSNKNSSSADRVATAVEQSNLAALRALEQSRSLPAGRATKLPLRKPAKENEPRKAVTVRDAPLGASERPVSQPSIAPRKPKTDHLDGRLPAANALKEGALGGRLRAPFRPGGTAPVRSIKPSALADLDSNYQTAHKRVQEALQRESKLAVDKVQAAECEVVRARNRQQRIERALECQSVRTSQERKVMRMLLSSEHTLRELEKAGSISAVRSASGRGIDSVQDMPAAVCQVSMSTPVNSEAAPHGGLLDDKLFTVPEESPQLAQVYDMSVMRAAQRQPCKQLLRDALRPKPMSTRLRGISEECYMRSSELSDGQSCSGGTVVVHGSLDSFPRHSVGHNPMFGEAPDAQAQNTDRPEDMFGGGSARHNPAFEPSDSSSLREPSNESGAPGGDNSGLGGRYSSSNELSRAASGASIPSHLRSLAEKRAAQAFSERSQEMPKLARHQRGRVLPGSASLGRLMVPSCPPQSTSEASVTGPEGTAMADSGMSVTGPPCLELPSCLRQLAALGMGSVTGPAAELSAHSVSVSAHQSGDLHSQSSVLAAAGAQAQEEMSERLPFTSRVHLHGQVLCEDLQHEDSPVLADLRPWGHQEQNRGTFSSTLSFLDHVRPSERFSPLENSLGASEAVAGHRVNASNGSACVEGADSTGTLARGALKPDLQLPRHTLRGAIRDVLMKTRCRMQCKSTKASTRMSVNAPAASVPTLSGSFSAPTASGPSARSEAGAAPVRGSRPFACLGRFLGLG